VVALGGKPVGEVGGGALLFEPIADDQPAGGPPTLETVCGAVQAGPVTALAAKSAKARRLRRETRWS
jgi:hypothetical protein